MPEKLNIPPNSIISRMSRNEPAKNLKSFHEGKVLISYSSLTMVLNCSCIFGFTFGVEGFLVANELLKQG